MIDFSKITWYKKDYQEKVMALYKLNKEDFPTDPQRIKNIMNQMSSLQASVGWIYALSERELKGKIREALKNKEMPPLTHGAAKERQLVLDDLTKDDCLLRDMLKKLLDSTESKIMLGMRLSRND